MHDIDRTYMEAGQQEGYGQEFAGESGEWSGEWSGESGEIGELPMEMTSELASSLDEADELALAAELLSVQSEEELDQFLGGLFKKVASGVKSLARNPVLKAVGGALKGVAKTALPIAAGAVGTYFGGPLGGMVGKQVGSWAASKLELQEFAGQGEDELDAARRFVRTGAAAIRAANRAPMTQDPARLASMTIQAAARKYAPQVASKLTQILGLPQTQQQRPGTGQGQSRSTSGRWFRRGKAIILIGA